MLYVLYIRRYPIGALTLQLLRYTSVSAGLISDRRSADAAAGMYILFETGSVTTFLNNVDKLEKTL